jgi:hypothetical protein
VQSYILVDRSVGQMATVEYKELVHSLSTVLYYSYKVSLFLLFCLQVYQHAVISAQHFTSDMSAPCLGLGKAIHSKLSLRRRSCQYEKCSIFLYISNSMFTDKLG